MIFIYSKIVHVLALNK